ncbi:MAG: valine--tRNA ligase [Spirulinaceae cyanobacterium SM2_1_0]|nr:valine--tRNA ligase [Spirulinaceae cyanobacterium SM2_1_0]
MTATIPTLATQYDPAATEAKWQQYWEDRHIFHADPTAAGDAYAITIPPPNVTGSLHMGHAFETALIDTLVRYHRMLGRNTLCLPGTDHASIAVHTLLERQLKAEGQTREAIGREAFMERAWAWKAESGDRIVNQLRRLGLSADWTRERFTLDPGLSAAVIEVFIRLYEQGLIYRGNYMVNWCPASESAVSDLEVENKEVDGRLWHFRYPLVDEPGLYVEVATTRPETMLGDTAVAVNPDDTRYQHLVGRNVMLPIANRQIPIVADQFVDPSFGTGCVKVTPAHDPNDFEMGQRHQLPFINILNKNGTLNANAGDFAGQDRFEARQGVVRRLEVEGLLAKVEEHRHTVPYSDRGKVPVEPLLSTQWFVRIEPLAQKALHDLDTANSPRFVPERWQKVYRDWLVRLKDWCISRQLWWGHQIPAWYAISETGGKITDDTPFIVARDETEAWQKARQRFGNDVQLERDPDVLDTWFSSGLWPFSTLGWPQQTADLERYFPNAILVTGFDIIFFWVARMTMLSGQFMGRMPFRDVYIHGLVRDENGKKMSKSANNGIDPLLLIEKYGADALRYTLIREVAGAGQDISLQYDREQDESESVAASRNFANKLWNAARFVLLNLEGQTPDQLGTPDLAQLELSDRWILSRFYQVTGQTRADLDAYGLGEAAKGLYEFIWGDFCDWYIELVKPRLRDGGDAPSRRVAQQTLAYVLEGILKLLHPFMPHITEEIWQTLTQRQGEAIAQQSYPSVDELLAPAPETLALDPPAAAPPITSDDQPTAPALQRAFLTLGALLVVAIVFRVLLGALDTLNTIPLVGSFFKLVGFGYATWAGYRYLLRADRRQESLATLRQWIDKILNTVEWSAATSAGRSGRSQPAGKTLVDPNLEADFALTIETVRVIRNLRAAAGIKPSVQSPAILQTDSEHERQILEASADYIRDMGKCDAIRVVPTLADANQQAFVGVVGTVQVLIPLAGLVDIEALRAKLLRDLSKIEGEIKSLTARLSNANFTSKAPAEVVQGAQEALAEAQKQAEILRDRLARLQ